jgi:hypothetical protein
VNEHLSAATTPSQPVSSRHETTAVCAGPGCRQPIRRQGTGRPARFCSPACRTRSHRAKRAKDMPITVEVDYGSATSRGRPAGAAWMVRLRRGDKAVIVAVGQSRAAADRLAEQLTDLVTTRGSGDP